MKFKVTLATEVEAESQSEALLAVERTLADARSNATLPEGLNLEEVAPPAAA